MKFLKLLPEIIKILSLLGILASSFFKASTPIRVDLPDGSGTSEIIATFMADLEKAKTFPIPSVDVTPPAEPLPIEEVWERGPTGKWRSRTEK